MSTERRDDGGEAAGGESEEHRPSPTEGMRELRDPRDMRALAHPIRLALLEALTVHGPLTATQAGALIGESPSSCSFHLRTLARHNFVEETGDGQGRQRPWRVVTIGNRMNPPFDDLQAVIAAEALSSMYFDLQHERLRQARAARSSTPREWVLASDDASTLCWVTAEELQEINEAVFEVLMRYRDRLGDPQLRPAGARLVELLYHAFLVDIGKPSQAGDGDQTPMSADPAGGDGTGLASPP
jgi:DNA-binding transcriptional ArsR family regulator